MGGRESIKGYLYQTWISILQSLNQDWTSIIIEPETENDKIDIIWTYENSTINVCQVKSSINNFTKNNILEWVAGLYEDNPKADKFIVLLIGNSNATVKSFFNNIASKQKSEFLKFEELYSIKEKIQVKFEPENLETLEAAVIAGIDQFLHSHNIEANYLVKKLIAGGMVNQVLNFSTEGTETSREDFEELILRWLDFNYSKQLKKETNLSLNFYLTNKVDFTKSMHRISASENFPDEHFSDELEEIKNIIEEILSFEVRKNQNEEDDDDNDLLKGIIDFKIPNLNPRMGLSYDNADLILTEYEKDKIIENAKYFNINIPEAIFNFGELKETKTFNVAFGPKWTLDGTEQEKGKKELFDKLDQKLSKLADFKIFWKEFTELSILPITLSNEGKELKENIRVRLFFPKETEILFHHNFPSPNRISNLQLINDTDSFFYYFLKHQKDSNVLEYYSNNILHSMPFIPLNPFFSRESHDYESNKYRRMLENCFDYEIFRDREKEIILECEIEELNTSDKIGLPAYIFIKEKSSFSINYEILCKNEPKKITGKLSYIASS